MNLIWFRLKLRCSRQQQYALPVTVGPAVLPEGTVAPVEKNMNNTIQPRIEILDSDVCPGPKIFLMTFKAESNFQLVAADTRNDRNTYA